MDLAHLSLAQAANPYGLETEPLSNQYGAAMEVEQPPRSMSFNFGVHQSSLIQVPIANLHEEQQPWPQRVLDEVRDLFLLLSPDGSVRYASPSSRLVTGFEAEQIEHNMFSRFIHDDDKPVFDRELHECIAMARPLRCHFRLYKPDNSMCVLEAHGHPHLTPLNNDGRQFCHGFFIVCRPYHTRSTQLLDSFLERKLENIRLKEYIAQLKKEEDDDINATTQQTKALQMASFSTHRIIAQPCKALASNQSHNPNPIPFLDPTIVSGEDNESSDTTGNIDDLYQGLWQTATGSQSEDTSHIDEVERRTGLLYGAGEISQGISTGARQARLYQSSGSQTQLQQRSEQQDQRENEPRKRLKGEYRCTDCGTSNSPEWRKGPDGPKTLCNACGLRWAKREKKRQDTGL
ncbi:hypothetical protein BJX61DRAFT_531222 [Aspergillus egyptiacus]|nr:hypothetical protein BJX61DRAFT_531222 [Aspergillus egyptiacus]